MKISKYHILLWLSIIYLNFEMLLAHDSTHSPLFAKCDIILPADFARDYFSDKTEHKKSGEEVDSVLILKNILSNLIGEENSGIEVSGFIDYNFYHEQNKSELKYGQFEVDFETELADKLTFEGALVLDEDRFVPGSGYLDYHFSGNEEGHSARGGFFSNTGMHLGQFDVPFGKYFEQLPSPGRTVSTMPVVVEKTINGMNMLGYNAYASHGDNTFNVFVTNGLSGGVLIGGHAGTYISEQLGIGLSYLENIKRNNLNSRLYSANIAIEYKSYSLNGEFIYSDGIYEGAEDMPVSKHFGFYADNTFQLESISNLPLALTLRVGYWQDDSTNDDYISHGNVSLNYSISERLATKIEYHLNRFSTGNDTHTSIIQIVLSF